MVFTAGTDRSAPGQVESGRSPDVPKPNICTVYHRYPCPPHTIVLYHLVLHHDRGAAPQYPGALRPLYGDVGRVLRISRGDCSLHYRKAVAAQCCSDLDRPLIYHNEFLRLLANKAVNRSRSRARFLHKHDPNFGRLPTIYLQYRSN